ncbi:MAG: ABC transporter ATP-binding protein [Fuerstiella sp.]|nr:ABC transporter ATP-binding protein [Fuerstiella sp.]
MALVEVDNLSKDFPIRGGILGRQIAQVHAVTNVTLRVQRGDTLGIIGESGCGKSTLGKIIVRLLNPTSGEIRFDGIPIHLASHRELMPLRRRMQFIFQDPYSSLNPKMTAGQMLAEVIKFHQVVPARQRSGYIDELLGMVQLGTDARNRYPHEFSGGQRQRLNIARALAVKPEFIIADEPVSALDVSVQAQVLNLLMDLRDQFGLTLMFISHDLKVIEHFCDQMVVMYLGQLVEKLSCDAIHANAKHPYTQALLRSNPINDPQNREELYILKGEVPSPRNPPAGCPFVTRCELAEERCNTDRPQLVQIANQHEAACWLINGPATGTA